jgi:hypothetical protein
MRIKITRDQVRGKREGYGQVEEVELHHFVTDASDIGIPPGPFPMRIETDLGNGQPFLLVRSEGDSARYAQSLGCIQLTVFND